MLYFAYICSMYLYNVSVIIENEHHDSLLDWIRNNWLSNLPVAANLLKMINSPHEGHTYCIQLIVSSEEEIQAFQQTSLILLQEQIGQHHQEKAFIFDSVMQYLS